MFVLQIGRNQTYLFPRVINSRIIAFEFFFQDYNNLLHDLSDLQRADMTRRSHVVAKIPVS